MFVTFFVMMDIVVDISLPSNVSPVFDATSLASVHFNRETSFLFKFRQERAVLRSNRGMDYPRNQSVGMSGSAS